MRLGQAQTSLTFLSAFISLGFHYICRSVMMLVLKNLYAKCMNFLTPKHTIYEAN